MAGLNSLRDNDTTPESKSDVNKFVTTLIVIAIILIVMAIFGVNPNG